MYLSGLEGPTFYDSGRNPISNVMCGQPYTFDVPGYGPQVWLEQSHNGMPGYNGPLSIPMNPYTANCTTEPGTYINTVYAMQNGQRGALIGTVSFNVLPMQTAPTVTAPTAGQAGTFMPTGAPTSSSSLPAGSSPGIVYSGGGGGVPGDIGGGIMPTGGPAGAGPSEGIPWTIVAIGALIFFAGRGFKRG